MHSNHYYEEPEAIVEEILIFLGLDGSVVKAGSSEKVKLEKVEQLTIAFTDIASNALAQLEKN